MADFAGLDKLFSDARVAEDQLEQAPTSYGSDAPVSVKGTAPDCTSAQI